MARNHLLALLLLVAGIAFAPPAAAADTCRPESAGAGALTSTGMVRLYHAKGSLYSCVTYKDKTTTRRLGPWAKGGRYDYYVVSRQITWTVPGAKGDRIWASDVRTGRPWITGLRARPISASGGASTEGRIASLSLGTSAVFWITEKDEAYMTTFTAVEGKIRHTLGKLPGPMRTAKRRIVRIGQWSDLSDRADKIGLWSGSDAPPKHSTDWARPCGDGRSYTWNFTPTKGQKAIRLRWTINWPNAC